MILRHRGAGEAESVLRNDAMAWDSSRSIPWRQLARDWIVFAVLMTVVLLVWSRDRLDSGVFLGLVTSLPVYLGFGAVLAKLGYRRKLLAEMRAETGARAAAKRPPAPATPTRRPRPAPTKRTGGSPPSRRR